MESILVIDGDPGFRKLLETILRGEGYDVDVADSMAGGLEKAHRQTYDLLLTDLKLRDGDGLSILRWFREYSPETPVITITGFGTVHSAVEAMKQGAVDYLGKPLTSPDELRILVRRTLEHGRMEQHCRLLEEEERRRFACFEVLAGHPRMAAVLEGARQAALTSAPVLLTGELGVGKRFIAGWIHGHSHRAANVFSVWNCAAGPPELTEAELFGVDKIDPKGAAVLRQGRLELASGGTLYLEGIEQLSASAQEGLLRVIRERACVRLGGTRKILLNVRLMAGCQGELERLVEEGKFREELFQGCHYRRLDVPPLRECASAIPALARHFLERAAKSQGKTGLRLSSPAEGALQEYSWPGNLRELENLMERAAILGKGVIEAEHLPPGQPGKAPRAVLFKDIERKAILEALEDNMGNRTRTAKQLGISLRTLQYRLREYGMTALNPEAE